MKGEGSEQVRETQREMERKESERERLRRVFESFSKKKNNITRVKQD